VIYMCGNDIKITCQNAKCNSKNVYKNVGKINDPEFARCPVCKHISVAYIKDGTYSGICEYHGPLSKTAVGVINADGDKIYVTANGLHLTRNEFIKFYGVDPVESLYERLRRGEVFDYIQDLIDERKR
jgi:hypothetical protein